MNQYNRRQQILVVVVVIVLFLTLVAIYDTAGADGNGKKNDPLPTQSNGCNEASKDKNPHCNPVSVATEVKVTPEPTKVKVQPTSVATKVESKPTEVKYVEPTVEPVVLPVTVTPEATVTACSDEVCSPCEFLEDALEDGMMVIIIDRDKVEVYEDMSIRIPGQFDLLATGLLSQSGYGD